MNTHGKGALNVWTPELAADVYAQDLPTEPAGVGAVVRDAAGFRWVLADPGSRLAWRREGADAAWASWVELSSLDRAPLVLSWGVAS